MNGITLHKKNGIADNSKETGTLGNIVTLGQESARFKRETSRASIHKAEENASEDGLHSSSGISVHGADSPSNVR